MLHAACCMLHATCYMLHATQYSMHAACCTLQATRYTMHAACYIYMLHAVCFDLEHHRLSCVLYMHALCMHIVHACAIHAPCMHAPDMHALPVYIIHAWPSTVRALNAQWRRSGAKQAIPRGDNSAATNRNGATEPSARPSFSLSDEPFLSCGFPTCRSEPLIRFPSRDSSCPTPAGSSPAGSSPGYCRLPSFGVE